MNSFFLPGECSDSGYRNVRDGAHIPLVEGRTFTESLWQRYAPLADPHFREDARAHFIERFWEMYLAVALIDRGFQLLPGTGTGPEFSFNEGEGHFWVEAVAPGPGTGADRVPEIELGVAYAVPTEKILLRFANAVAEKRSRYHSALEAGIIAPASGYVLAINSRRIPHAAYGNTLPFYLQALLPVGNLTVMLNRSTREIEDRFYEAREKILKSNKAPVSTQPLLNRDFGFVSAVLHSAVDCVNRPTMFGEDFSVLHNPLAVRPLNPSTFDWCDQYFYGDGILEKRLANTGLADGGRWNHEPPRPKPHFRCRSMSRLFLLSEVQVGLVIGLLAWRWPVVIGASIFAAAFIGWWRIYFGIRRLQGGGSGPQLIRDARNLALCSGASDDLEAARRILDTRELPPQTFGLYFSAFWFSLMPTALSAVPLFALKHYLF